MPIVRAFLSVATQWRVTPLADGRVLHTGLDYAGVRADFESAGIAIDPALWAGLKTMERAAIAARNGYRG